MVKKVYSQNDKFCGLPVDLESRDHVLHVINLDLIRDSSKNQNMIDKVLKIAKDKNSEKTGIYFLNYLERIK